MALLEIKVLGDEVLHRVAEPVRKVNAEIKQLIADMFETMEAAQGVGLAAPQVGVSKRIFVIDVGDGKAFAMVNPILFKGEGEVVEQEGCLSIPGVYMDVRRYKKVVFKGRDAKDRAITVEATGLLAKALQHELDHLDGKVFVDLVEDQVGLKQELSVMRERIAEAAKHGIPASEAARWAEEQAALVAKAKPPASVVAPSA